MITAVTDIDLIAKELQKHEKCYREYSRIVREETLEEEHVDTVMVNDYILAAKQCISMETLQSLELVLGLVKADISWRKDYAKHSEIR